MMRSALDRFVEKCAFDPTTGCVMWIGGTTSGHGHNQPYGAFWFEGRRWFAHRWAAAFIHGLEIHNMHVDHCCPCGPSTLCVQHLQVATPEENRKLQNVRADHRCAQNPSTRQHWLLVTKGFEQYEWPNREILDIPWFDKPEWLCSYLLARKLT
jgi:hypothetical protein